MQPAPPDTTTDERDAFLHDVIDGLSASPKSVPCKYFYDEVGSVLFDRITETEEYYPTRTELAIMRTHIGEMAEQIGPGTVLIEYGSGSSLKTRVLLDHLDRLAAYVPIDISREHLLATAEQLRTAYPALHILPIAADYTTAFNLPDLPQGKHVIYFPGSTIGNFDEDQAAVFLEQAARIAGSGGGLLIGVDLKKDPKVLEAAYDDAEGVTSAFNLNLLDRINRELGGTFDRDQFAHRAIWNGEASRIETYLVSLRDQTVEVDGTTFHFGEDEPVHTENSHKYTVEGFADFAAQHGFTIQQCWTDPDDLFSVQYFEAEA